MLVPCKLGGKALAAGSNIAGGARDDVIPMVGTFRACLTLRKACNVKTRDVCLT
jgi:hypothetical protein